MERHHRSGRKMQSKLDADPLLAAFFDLPAGVQTPTSSKGQLGGHRTPSRRQHDRTLRRVQSPDLDTDTSLLHGESISLTDEEYSDALAVAEEISPHGIGSATSSFTAYRPNMVSLPARLPSGGYARGSGGISPTLSGRSESPPLHPGDKLSPKKKKKRKSGAIKSLKKLVGRKGGKSSSAVLTVSSSFDDDGDSILSSPTADMPSYGGDNEHSPDMPRNQLSMERLSHLRSKIGRIRSTIHSLEGDLIATRTELGRAHQHLHLATMELADMQRAALEADISLSNLAHRSISPAGGRVSPLQYLEVDISGRFSTRSSSSERLHYFTPTSSLLESEDDGRDCFTPRSRASSYESFLSLSDSRDRINTPILEESGRSLDGDKDRTPLTKNGKPKSRRQFKFDKDVKAPTALKYGAEPMKEPGSIDTPSTAASTQNEEVAAPEANAGATTKQPGEQKRVTFYRQESFIRAHDLAIACFESDNNSLLPLHKTEMSDVVDALFHTGYELAMDESDRWTPELSTGKILSKRAKNGEVEGPMGPWPNAAHGVDVLVWTTKYHREGHGSEYPVVKARGLIPTSAQSMVELLLDSSRSKEYNKMSLGRVDEHTFAKGVDKTTRCSETGIQGEAKIVRSKSQPPVVRKPVELRLLLHARRLPSEEGEEGAKYLTIGRSVWETEEGTARAEDTSATRCEMLLSANLIRDVQCDGAEQWCEVTTITHGVSPGIPISIGKRIGLAAAAKYIRDIRAVFERQA